nr:MAG TPA: protein of Unknown Function (DUF326) [Caudoviricetes sp.]
MCRKCVPLCRKCVPLCRKGLKHPFIILSYIICKAQTDKRLNFFCCKTITQTTYHTYIKAFYFGMCYKSFNLSVYYGSRRADVDAI